MIRMIRGAPIFVLILSLTFAAAAAAQVTDDGLITGIHPGDCAGDIGVAAAPLTEPRLPEGDMVGAPDARPVATSFSTVPLSLEALLGDDHVVAVVASQVELRIDPEDVLGVERVEKESTAACGAVGGIRTDNGALVIELGEIGDSGISGVAYLAPSGAGQTDVSLFLAGLGSARPQPSAETTAEPTDDGDTAQDSTTTTTAKDANEPSAEEVEEPAQDAAAVMETYVSPNFGYALSYDPTEWTIAEGPSTDGGFDHIGLEAGFTTVYLSGTSGLPDAQLCVQVLTDTQTGESNVVSFEPLPDESGGDVSDAFATTRITRATDGGGSIDQAFYTRCIVLPSGDAVLAIQQFAADLIYDSAAEQREQLLAGLVLP